MLNPQIEYLTACRPMCYSMGNAVRWLKLQISKVDIDLADFEARKILCETIDVFIRDRIRFARPLISGSAVDNMSEDEVIVTYGHHRLVEHALAWAKHQGRNYAITVVDDPFDRTGLAFAKRLSAMGYDRVTYAADLGVLNSHLRDATCVLVGAESVFSNGALYARAGTCDVAIAAKEMGVGLTALCEAINFTDRVSVDSLTYNEIDPERCTEDDFRLLFDTTKPEYISSLVNELGYATSSSVASLLRKLEVL